MQFICSITDLSPTICLLLRAASGNCDNGLFCKYLFKNCIEITDFPPKITFNQILQGSASGQGPWSGHRLYRTYEASVQVGII